MWRSSLIVFVILSFSFVSGRLLNLGGTWNRGFRVTNYTVEDYAEDLAWRVGNETANNGLGLTLQDSSYKVDGTLLGVTMKGNAKLSGGLVTTEGSILPPVFVPDGGRTGYENLTQTYAQAWIFMSLRLTLLETVYDVNTDFTANNAQGTVETSLNDTSLFFTLTHTFETGKTTVEADVITFLPYSVVWTIKPKNVNTYVLQELLTRDNVTEKWYETDLQAWQKGYLRQLLEDQTEGLTFPINKY